MAFCFHTAFLLQAVGQPFKWLGRQFTRNISPLERLCHLFLGNINPFKQLSYPFIRNIKRFERLGHACDHLFVEDIRPFEWLDCSFVENIRLFEQLGHSYYSIPLNFLLNDMGDKSHYPFKKFHLFEWSFNSMVLRFVQRYLHKFIGFKLLFCPYWNSVHTQAIMEWIIFFQV